MNYTHKELALGKWAKLTLSEQMANIGSEVERAINWRNKNNAEYSRLAFERALELLDLTLSCNHVFSRLKELARLREVLADYFAFNNNYRSTEADLKKYFFAFNYAARAH